MSQLVVYDGSGYIIVDRTCRPPYPYWIESIKFPEHENTGFSEYHLSSLKLWLHPMQIALFLVKGDTILDCMKTVVKNYPSRLSTCLNLQDGYAIAEKGPDIFKKFFDRNEVFLWKSVVIKKDEDERKGIKYILLVPFLCVRGNKVVIRWRWIRDRWIFSDPALRFKSNLDKVIEIKPFGQFDPCLSSMS